MSPRLDIRTVETDSERKEREEIERAERERNEREAIGEKLDDEALNDRIAERASEGKKNRNRREEKWHVGREIPLAVIVALIGVAVSNVIAYSVFKTEMQLYIQYSDEKFLAYTRSVDDRFNSVRLEMSERTQDRIRKAQVLEMFASRDAQIRNVTSNMLDIKKGIGELNSLMHEMRRDLLREKRGG